MTSDPEHDGLHPDSLPESVCMLTTQQLADALVTSTRTIRRNVARARLGKMDFPLPVRVGSTIRWRLAEVQRYVQALPKA